MILIDFTQIVIGGLMATIHKTGEEIDDKLVRHVVLNTLRNYRTKFLKEYGELVICCDNKHYWRRDYFPNYKINRKKDREQSDYDWNSIFINLNLIRDEIKENFNQILASHAYPCRFYGYDVVILNLEFQGLDKNVGRQMITNRKNQIKRYISSIVDNINYSR